MKFPIFTGFIVILLWITFRRMAADRKDAKEQKKFWDQEDAANATRRQDISQLPYVRLVPEDFPLDLGSEDAVLSDCHRQFLALTDKKMLNLTGMSNTTLKLKYGAPNLPALTEYDNNFTELICLLQEWGNRLHELSYRKEAEAVLHTAVTLGSDIKGTFTLLASIYLENKNYTGFEHLKQYAKLLRSLQKEPILKALDAMDTYREVISFQEPLPPSQEEPPKSNAGEVTPPKDAPWANLFDEE